MSIQAIQQLVATELQQITDKISSEIASPISLISNISEHITKAGGKRLRPITVLLGAKCFSISSTTIIDLATVIEFFHISSLLHDDVIDNSSKRRGVDAAHVIYGNKAAILVGDYLFSKSFQLLSKINNPRVLQVLADTSNIITKGEIQQLIYANNPNVTVQEYIDIIQHKTAVLFETAAQMGAIIANAKEEDIQAMAKFGYYLGRAFQIIDDILDYDINNQELGKNIGNDLQEGKITIPLIYAIQAGSSSEQNIIKDAIRNGSIDKLEEIKQIIHSTNALKKAHKLAEEQISHATKNLVDIPGSEYRDALEQLATFVVQRDI